MGQVRLPLWVSLMLLVLLVLLVLLLAVYGWVYLAAGATQRQLAAEQQKLAQQLETDRAAIRRDAAAVLTRQTGELETLFGSALAGSVRGSMLRGAPRAAGGST